MGFSIKKAAKKVGGAVKRGAKRVGGSTRRAARYSARVARNAAKKAARATHSYKIHQGVKRGYRLASGKSSFRGEAARQLESDKKNMTP